MRGTAYFFGLLFFALMGYILYVPQEILVCVRDDQKVIVGHKDHIRRFQVGGILPAILECTLHEVNLIEYERLRGSALKPSNRTRGE